MFRLDFSNSSKGHFSRVEFEYLNMINESGVRQSIVHNPDLNQSVHKRSNEHTVKSSSYSIMLNQVLPYGTKF